MQKRTKNILAIAAVAGVGYLIYRNYQNRDKAFVNAWGRLSTLTTAETNPKADCGCKFYAGSAGLSVGTVITGWKDGCGKRGVVVSQNSSQTLVCPEGQTSVMPVSLIK